MRCQVNHLQRSNHSKNGFPPLYAQKYDVSRKVNRLVSIISVMPEIRINITPRLLGSLAECYYKEVCDQRGWAYTSLEQIYKNKIQNGKLEFKKGFERILVRIPDGIKEEIETIAKPSNYNEAEPSFVYDFLACKAYESKDPRVIEDTRIEDFRWAEVKSGYSELSSNQIKTLSRIKIPLALFWIDNPRGYARYVRIFYEEGEGKYWLSQLREER